MIAVEARKDHIRPAGGRGQRRCAQSRHVADRDGMIRFVVGPEGVLVPDLAERLPGRGVWLTASRDVIRAALGGRAIGRALKRAVRVPDGLLADVERLLRRRCAETVGLARRGGILVTGSDQVEGWLRQGKAGLLVIATDAAEGQSGRLRALGREVPVVQCLDRRALGGAVGREGAVYAALAPGALAQRLQRDARRLAGVVGREPCRGPTAPVVEENPPRAVGISGRDRTGSKNDSEDSD